MSVASERTRPAFVLTGDGRSVAMLLAFAALIVGLALTAFGTLAYDREQHESAQIRFQRTADRLGADVRRRLVSPLHGVNGARGVFAASVDVSRSEFADYVATLDLEGEFGGVRGFGYIERVRRDDAEAFAARVRADGLPSFQIRGAGAFDELFVVKYVEPMRDNVAAIGLDVGAEPVRREAIDRAIATGAPALTRAVRLVQDDAARPGFLLMTPVYRRGSDPSTPEQRRQAVVGLAYAAIVVDEILGGVTEVTDGQIDLALFDAATAEPSRQVLSAGDASFGVVTGGRTTAPMFSTDRTVEVGGRTLALRMRSTPAFEATIDRTPPLLMASGGVLLSVLLALTLWLLASRRARAEALAGSMTADLERLAMVARLTSNAVVITDAGRRITWVNEGFTRMTGYTPQMARGRSPGELLQCPRTDEATVRRMREAFDAGQGFRGEIVNRRFDGHEYWIEIEVVPLRNAEGTLAGFMAIETDISERKAAEAALAGARREVERLARVAERTSNAVIITDRDKRIVWVNHGFERIYGYESAEALGRTPAEMLCGPHSDPETLAALARAAAAGAACRVEILNRRRDGREVWIDVDVQPTFDDAGELNGFVEIASDITASRRAAQELARERQRLADILERAGAAHPADVPDRSGAEATSGPAPAPSAAAEPARARTAGSPAGRRQPGHEAEVGVADSPQAST